MMIFDLRVTKGFHVSLEEGVVFLSSLLFSCIYFYAVNMSSEGKWQLIDQ